jgi:hypothetical protein
MSTDVEKGKRVHVTDSLTTAQHKRHKQSSLTTAHHGDAKGKPTGGGQQTGSTPSGSKQEK